ncbi:hypothetical protein NIES2100_45200 [Calothrix sp. NIES-2100]|nr:hypothetical protein NIES2100_45200 [Calothrix sp. NIES-2100]
MGGFRGMGNWGQGKGNKGVKEGTLNGQQGTECFAWGFKPHPQLINQGEKIK